MGQSIRKGWIDIARAFAIIFVIFVHIGNELSAYGINIDLPFTVTATAINPIKLPLFFAISGYLFSSRNSDAEYFIKREFKTRLIPYLVWGSFIGIVGSFARFYRCDLNFSSFAEIFLHGYVLPLLKGNLIWFVPCLIIMEIIFFLLIKISRNNLYVMCLLTVLLTTCGYLISSKSIMPWKVDTALTCIQFMFFGYLLKHTKASELFENHNKSLITAAISGFLYILLLLIMNKIWSGCAVDINQGKYFNPVAFSVLAITGVMFMFSISAVVSSCKPLEFVGKNTLIYFVWHMYIVKVFILIFKITGALSFLPMCFSVLIITTACCFATAFVSVLINRYLGFTVGLKKIG